jgi:hypothetical protein
MAPIALLAGLLMLIFGGAALSTEKVAASKRMRQPSRPYAVATMIAGAILVVVGIGMIFG